jgi:cytochrome c-type biogenesis protein CcmH/NrfF
METLPSLDNAEEIRRYCLNKQCNTLAVEEIKREVGHWHTHCDTRLYEEIRMGKSHNPVSKANVYRFGGLVLAALSFLTCFTGPLIGLPIAGAGLGLYIYGQIDDWQTKRRREPVNLALERCEALEQELKNRPPPR